MLRYPPISDVIEIGVRNSPTLRDSHAARVMQPDRRDVIQVRHVQMRELGAVNVIDPYERTLVMPNASDLDMVKLNVSGVTDQ